jgi:hypothetical protein
MKSNGVQFFLGHPVEEQEKYTGIEKWKVRNGKLEAQKREMVWNE